MRSWKQLERTALLVEISFDGDAVQVMPTTRGIDRGGYQHRADFSCECGLKPEDIGATSLRVLECCS